MRKMKVSYRTASSCTKTEIDPQILGFPETGEGGGIFSRRGAEGMRRRLQDAVPEPLYPGVRSGGVVFVEERRLRGEPGCKEGRDLMIGSPGPFFVKELPIFTEI